jgi:hypothetical protein
VQAGHEHGQEVVVADPQLRAEGAPRLVAERRDVGAVGDEDDALAREPEPLEVRSLRRRHADGAAAEPRGGADGEALAATQRPARLPVPVHEMGDPPRPRGERRGERGVEAPADHDVRRAAALAEQRRRA